MKKFLTKAVAALASAVTLSSMVGAIPTSAIDMSYGVGKNSSMRYTVYTTKVSDTKVDIEDFEQSGNSEYGVCYYE